ncbi:MAG TPA: hypothetical protein V6D23_10385 [Candidatus Obscuribacterales bacterium]
MSNLSITPNTPVSQVVPRAAEAAKAKAETKPEAKQPALATDSLHKSNTAVSILGAAATGAGVGAALNALSALQAFDEVAVNPFASLFITKSELKSLVIGNSLSRAAWGAGVGAVVGGIVASQTDNKVAATLAGAAAGGIAGVFLNPTVDGVIRYAGLGAASGFAAAAVNQAIKK